MFQKLFSRQSTNPITQMSVHELQQHLQSQQAFQLIDVRSAEEYQYDKHVAGAKLIPLPALSQRLNEIARDTPIAIICRSGNRSQVAADLLTRHGFTNVSNVRGGMIAWRNAGFPIQ